MHIIDCIFRRTYPRIEIIMPTQYGKSLCVAIALILSAAILNEKWAIIAPNAEKAEIIMGYVITHLFDSPLFWSQLVMDNPLEKLKQERNKTRITFKGGGEIRIYSADAKNRRAVTKSLTGFGSRNIILDESSLIPNDLYGMVKRMLGGHKDNFLLEIGNPFERNHFYRTWNDPLYYKIYIDYQEALREGRYTTAYIEEMRKEAFFDVLYACVFPAEADILEGGWRRLIIRSQMEPAFTKEWNPEGRGRLGVDIAAGGKDRTVITLRFPNITRVVRAWSDKDLMAQIPIILEEMERWNVEASSVDIDDGGVGHGLSNRMQELGYGINQVMLGSSAVKKKDFANQRAERHWLAADWLKSGGKIYEGGPTDEKTGELIAYRLYQLCLINYKQNSNSQVMLEPKPDMQQRENIKSPDEVDSFILTFTNESPISEDDYGM